MMGDGRLGNEGYGMEDAKRTSGTTPTAAASPRFACAGLFLLDGVEECIRDAQILNLSIRISGVRKGSEWRIRDRNRR